MISGFTVKKEKAGDNGGVLGVYGVKDVGEYKYTILI